MSDGQFFSKVQVDSVRVVECGLWTNQEPPSGSMRADTNIDMSEPVVQRNQATGQTFSPMTLGITISFSDEPPSLVPRARVNVKLVGRVISDGDLSDHDIRIAVVSNMYPQAQAYISVLGGFAQMNSIVIPTADPEELVNLIENAIPKPQN